ncbi:hypothetical protein ACROYT_G038549 [Oculina patagonica]
MNTGAYASDDLITSWSCDNCGKELTRYHKFWKCESQHMTCFYCFADQTYDDLKNTSCVSCGKNLERITPLHAEKEHVFIYVDDSNMWIEAKKLAAVKSKLKCVEDPRTRLDIGKVTDVVASGRDVAWGTLYGSEPPAIDTVWQKIRDHGWKVVTNKRSTYTNKEKQVDHQMVADITALVSDRSVVKGKVVMVSGDADMIPAIKESLKSKWSIEIWMWESGISNSLRKLSKDNPECLKISELDSMLEVVTFTNFKNRVGEKEIPDWKSRSVIIKNVDFSPDEQWQKNLSEKLGWPFTFRWTGPEGVDNRVDYEDIILTFAHVKSVDGEEFEKIFPTIFEYLKQKYPGQVVNYPAYMGCDQKGDICFANRFEALQIVDRQLSVNGASSEDPSFKHGDELHEDETGFQVVQRKPRKRRTQQYSTPCDSRSSCKRGLNCEYQHTDDEKKFFRNPRKDGECWNKGHCKYGPDRCYYAHSNEDSFCRKCHKWGHLQEKCTLK